MYFHDYDTAAPPSTIKTLTQTLLRDFPSLTYAYIVVCQPQRYLGHCVSEILLKYMYIIDQIKAALIIIFLLTMHQVILCNVKSDSDSDKPTKNGHPTP